MSKRAKVFFKFSIPDFSVKMNTEYSQLSLFQIVVSYKIAMDTELERKKFKEIIGKFSPNLTKTKSSIQD